MLSVSPFSPSQAFDEAGPTVLEPVMKVEITIPVEYQARAQERGFFLHHRRDVSWLFGEQRECDVLTALWGCVSVSVYPSCRARSWGP